MIVNRQKLLNGIVTHGQSLCEGGGIVRSFIRAYHLLYMLVRIPSLT